MQRMVGIFLLLVLAVLLILAQSRPSESFEFGYAVTPQRPAYACITRQSAANVAKALVDHGESEAAFVASIHKVSGLCETIKTFTPTRVVREVERSKGWWVSLVIAEPSGDWLSNEVFVIFVGKYEPGIEL